jgi:hypothetical protein
MLSRIVLSWIIVVMDYGHGRCMRLEAPECCANDSLLARGSAVKLPQAEVRAARIGDLSGIVRSLAATRR